jgi:tetratricopeptide (TPR) repeat protein
MTETSAPPSAPLDSLVAQLADEFTERQKRGEQPDIEAYAVRYPEHAAVIRNVLTALRLIRLPASGSDQPDGESLPGTLGDFRLIREVGRGGMGVVYEAEQISLGRRVALKVLPFAATLDARQLQRFKNEAQAAGHLQHTHIVPVHFVGCERGVHFYAMQYVEGQTLAAVIADLRRRSDRPAERSSPATGPYLPPSAPATGPESAAGGKGAASAATQPVAGLSTALSHREPAFFRAAAQLAIQAAEALEHAHQMGVVHRDIKPANLMVDGRGSLWVTDFGLAQFQSDASLTLSGDLVGTVRYMSPEQALAKRILIDHRTDIYSLGVTLYELLTLRPAFAGKDRQELLRQISFEEPCRPRRLNRAIPPELETIVLKAMEKNPADRYPTAQALADDLRRYVEDKPILARRPTLLQRARKWGQRHRAVVRTAAACLLLTVALLAGGAGWVLRDQAARRAETEREASAALEEAAQWQREGRLPEALAAARRAAWVADAGDAGAAFRQRVQARRADLEWVAELEEARLQMTAVKEGHFDDELGDRLFAEAFQKAGLDVEAVPAAEAAERIQQSSVATELAAALDYWIVIRRFGAGRSNQSWKHLLQIARAADPDGWREQVRDALERDDQQALVDLARSEEARHQPPLTLVLLGELLVLKGAFGPAEAVLQQARQEHPGDFWVNLDLGVALAAMRPARWHEAIRFYTAAVAVRPQSPGAHANLGNCLAGQGRLDEAVAEFREALRLKNDYAEAHLGLGSALHEQGRVDEAIGAYRDAIRCKHDHYNAHCNLGIALRDKGRLDEAIAEYHEALRLKKNHPEAHNNLGVALEEKGRQDEAIAEYREAIRLKKDLPAVHSNLGSALRVQGRVDEAIAECQEAIRLDKDSPEAHNNLGVALKDKGRLDEAIAEYREALRLKKDFPEAHYNLGNDLREKRRLDEAIGHYQEAIRLRKDYLDAHNNLGIALREKGRLDEAIGEFQEAIRLQKDYPEAHNHLGVALRDKGRLDEAIGEFQEAIRLRKDYTDAHNNLGGALHDKGRLDEAIGQFQEAIRLRKDYPEAHYNLGNALRDKGELNEAIGQYREAIRLRKDYPEAHNNLGGALHGKGRLDEAIGQCQEAIRLKKDWPEAHSGLGRVLLDKGRLDEAIGEYREAIRLRKNDPLAHYDLGYVLSAKGQLDEAMAEYQEALRLKKDYAEAHCNLGHVLLRQGRFTEALAALKRGHELGSEKPGWPYPSAQWVRTAEQLVALEAKLPQVLKGDAQPADAAEQLVLARMCQKLKKLYAAASRLYADAFAAQPKLAEDLKAQHRYAAACAAALGGCGQGQDPPPSDGPERGRLRRQALDWLRADLRAYRKLLDKEPDKVRPAVCQRMQHWQQDSDFAGVRGDALAKLPAVERQAWQQLWADVADMLAGAQMQTTPEKKAGKE